MQRLYAAEIALDDLPIAEQRAVSHASLSGREFDKSIHCPTRYSERNSGNCPGEHRNSRQTVNDPGLGRLMPNEHMRVLFRHEEIAYFEIAAPCGAQA